MEMMMMMKKWGILELMNCQAGLMREGGFMY